LIDHRVDGVFELQNFPAHIDGDLLRQVAVGHRRRDRRYVAHLAGQVAGHGIHAVSQVFPGAGDAPHIGLAAELAFGADFAGHPRDLRGERTELVHHGVDGDLQLQDFPFDIDRDLLGEVPGCHRRGHGRDIAHLAGQIARHGIDAVGQVLPRARNSFDVGLAAELAFGADFTGDPGDFRCEGTKLVHHGVNRVFQFENFPFDIDGDFLGQVAIRHSRCHRSDVAHLGRQVAGH
jgi:hypothetical protein